MSYKRERDDNILQREVKMNKKMTTKLLQMRLKQSGVDFNDTQGKTN